MQDLKVLLLQADLIWENPDANREAFAKRIEENFDGHHLILLPETFTTGFPVNPLTHGETILGPTLNWMKSMASKTGAVLAGTLLLENEFGYANTLVWMAPDGDYRLYEKRHVFSMGGEDKQIKAGTQQVVVELNGWKIRPMICYDLRFPVWSKNRYELNEFEYDLAIYLANWPAVRSYPWRQLLIARAIENQAVVIGVNRIGSDNLGFDYDGSSMVIDAKGQVLTEGVPYQETAISVKLSGEELMRFREKFNVGRDWDDFEFII